MQRGGAATAAAGASLVLLALYLASSNVLPGDADVMQYSSGVFDMDVSRVVVDVTSGAPAYRPSVHPLQKLFVSPFGAALNRSLFDGLDRLAAARVLLAVALTLHALATGWLAFLLAGRSLAAGLLAGLLCGVSFSSLLAASIPESAAFSCLSTSAPLIFLGVRLRRPFTHAEAAGWAVLAVFAIGFTVTQVAHWAIALLVRAWDAHRGASHDGIPALLAKVAAAALAGAVLTVGASLLQARVYPGTPPFYEEIALSDEMRFARFDSIREEPLRHSARLALHFALLDFAAPRPGYSDFLIRDYGQDYWSLSLEEAGLRRWSAPQRVLALAVLAAVAAALVFGRFRGPLFAAVGLSVASQWLLHFVYGREYVLYSPNWHGAVVAGLVAGAWLGLPSRRRVVAGCVALLSAALLANNLVVLKHVYREVERGLDVRLRDSGGAPRPGVGGR